MKVGEVMTRYLEYLEPGATAQEAAVMMGELDVGSLPIGSATEMEGLVTSRDLLLRVVAAGLDPVATRAAQVMSRPLISCAESDEIQMVLDVMAGHHIRRMPVRNGRTVVGWITLGDLSRKLLLESGTIQAGLLELNGRAGTGQA